MRRGFAPHFEKPHFQHVDDLFAPKIDQIYNFIQILLGPILNFEPRTPTDFYPESSAVNKLQCIMGLRRVCEFPVFLKATDSPLAQP